MKKFRTINGCFEEIIAADPKTAITQCAIRRAIVSGEIPVKRIGTGKGWKYLCALEDVVSYFEGNYSNE